MRPGDGFTWVSLFQKEETIRSHNAPEYNFEGKKGKIHTIREGVIPPLMTTVVTGMADLTIHSNSLSVIVEPIFGYSEHIAMARTYGELRPGTGKIDICLQNHSAWQVTLPKQTTVEEIMCNDISPALLAEKPTGLKGSKGESIINKKK